MTHNAHHSRRGLGTLRSTNLSIFYFAVARGFPPNTSVTVFCLRQRKINKHTSIETMNK